MTEKRRKAIIRRRIFILCCVAVLVAGAAAVLGAVVLIKGAMGGDNPQSSMPQTTSDTSDVTSVPEEGEEFVTLGEYTLSADYSRLILVNGKNPLPQDYNYGWNLTTMEDKYHNGQLTQIDAGVWPYMKAMLEAAWADGVDLKVWSPYRSYETQNMLFRNQVERVGGDEEKAATVVARPGTSEHNTGLCADFNMASDRFESTEMYTWMCAHAEEYGFILRYPSDKIDITGVIYESWHWRFIGIKAAKEINKLGLTLEEYIEYKGLEPQAGLYENAAASQK